ncbi:MAG: hypothetical protein ACD_4C00288G0002 [uncultured bacterium (gcode 4)]|uniref:NodB homology domain-containing protein n=1 Tax=uncultured bacterium (gcode 4) TaxID=1234023 RepID=K2G8I4_9BACT|nr:MAG: hypothetical protein ACD_4C00288G0002 [uncultured bacterium (gcode 4)]
MLNLCLTFDYELFFNETSYSEEEVLIKTTCDILGILDKNNVKGTFFADVSSILRYKELKIDEFPDLAEKQLKQILCDGHDVQLHIHPHWYTSNIIDGKWNFGNENYRIHSFGFGNAMKVNANSIVAESTEYLNSLLRQVDSQYSCIAYRAGGFCIQPETELFKILKKNGILIDSSVCKGIYKDSGIHYYSYFNLPKEINWWFAPEKGIGVSVERDIENNMFEVPVGSISKVPLKWIISKGSPKITSTPLRGMRSPQSLVQNSKINKIYSRLISFFRHSLIFTLDSLHYKSLEKFVKYYLKIYDCSKNDVYITIICHPKFSSNQIIENMDQFIKLINNNYEQVKFVTLKEIYDKVGK